MMVRKLIIILLLCSICFGVSPTLQNFNTGVVSFRMEPRIDVDKYQSALRVGENMLPTIQGPITRRPGTRYIVTGAEVTGETEIDRPAIDPCATGISTMEQLALIGNNDGYPMDGDYQLLNDLDATGILFWPIGLLASDPDVDSFFTGTFDGRYYTIKNISYTMDTIFEDVDFFEVWSLVGLFAKLNGTVENLIISNMEIVNVQLGAPTFEGLSNAGFLAGTTGTNAIVTNVHVQGTMNITNNAISLFGGFSSTGLGIFSHCSSDMVFSGTIALASQTMSRVGGYIGSGSGGTFTDCYAVGSITLEAAASNGMQSVGGFCGNVINTSSKTWTNCYSAITLKGKVSDTKATVGGLVGFLNDFFDASGNVTFSDCFWDGSLLHSFSTDDPIGFSLFDIGHIGAVGDDYGAVPPNDYDAGDDVADVTEGTSGDGGANDMFKQATYTNWDFSEPSGVWEIDEDVGYPDFQWFVEANLLPREIENDVIRLISFEISTDVSFIIEAGNQYMRFITDDGS